eukprot:3379770-Amphidinium_carterae.1
MEPAREHLCPAFRVVVVVHHGVVSSRGGGGSVTSGRNMTSVGRDCSAWHRRGVLQSSRHGVHSGVLQ